MREVAKLFGGKSAAVPIQESAFAFSHAGFTTRSASLRLPRICEGNHLLGSAGFWQTAMERVRGKILAISFTKSFLYIGTRCGMMPQ
jgi:hypothetical protein